MNDTHPKKSIIALIWIFTALVYALVIVLHELPKSDWAPSFISTLPALNAVINGTCFTLLVVSFFVIRRGNVSLHKRLNTSAMILSVLFLLSYVTNHFFSGDTVYMGSFKGLYYFVLITHILLAGVSLPFILLAYYHGFIDNRAKHRKLVKFVYPMWLYVTFTGVLVFLFLCIK